MSQVTVEEEIAIAIAYGDTSSMAAMGAAQSIDIQKIQTGHAASALWASYLTSLGRRLIAYKSAELIAQRTEGPKKEGAKAVMNREYREASTELAQQIKHVLNRKARQGKKGARFNEHERALIAMVAIDEYSHDYCQCCQGAGEIPLSDDREGMQPTQECPVCRGALKHKFTDREREASFISHAKELQYEFRTSGNLVKVVTTARAVIRLACKTAVFEYKRICG